ncbi:RNA polymerase sigma factor [Thermomonospora cellulosilytica]|uniref:DNA-directed RNA polymerase specialized sigma24 family protein n=1 Tax=Thermomonospora cellulosilytica TaxID=1411118 RepID=A0A7W3R812_9ACTN|nr:hypothetical protein [Thermomonospora cellulosilytica]MBA9003089.1 DNA-directed RNA polymerase specialized sigma24 family protein [Thermomonospora cellulosilytica]
MTDRQTGEYTDNALTVAERTFCLLTAGPCPLGIDGRKLGHGLPARLIDLGELRNLLLSRSCSDELKDAAWAELVRQARTGDPAWVVGCVGVAMPGLAGIAQRVIRSGSRHCADDIAAELVTEFVAQLARIDIGRPRIAARLLLWARKAAFRARGRETRAVPLDPAEMPVARHRPDSDPMLPLLEAVRRNVITPSAASLIIATRLEGASVQDVAQALGVPADRLYKRRQAAEARLRAAIQDGQLSVRPDDELSNRGLCSGVS